MTTLMEKEINEQPDALQKTASFNQKTIESIVKKVKARKIRNIVVSARGSSNNACVYFKYVCETFVGIPVSFAAPSVITLYNGKLDLTDTLVIGVSQSGKAEDVLAVLIRARYNKAVTVAITNDETSPVATTADYHLFMNVGEEKSVAATKTLTAEMYLLGLLACEMADDKSMRTLLDTVPEEIKKILLIKDQIAALSQGFLDKESCYILSRGFMYAVGNETALKIQETTYINARSFAISDFYHGPFAVINDLSQVIMLAPVGKETPDYKAMLARLLQVNAKVSVFSDDLDLVADINKKVIMPYVDEIIAPFSYVVAAQLFACCLSQGKGLNPDNPRGLKKVTITK